METFFNQLSKLKNLTRLKLELEGIIVGELKYNFKFLKELNSLEILELQLAGTYGGSSVYPLISKECCKETFN